jgi:tRNA pseudouridine38-40 synthase
VTRIRLVVAYDGGGFCGWQLQPEDRTVQGELEEAVARMVGEPVRLHASGRTDSGVHATAQVVHFDVPDERADLPWTRALNSLTTDDVAVLRHDTVSADFHARFGAISKTYEYILWHERRFLLPQRRRFVWDCGPLDFNALGMAAEVLQGRHDFSAFQNVGTPVKDTVRTLEPLEMLPGTTPHETVLRFTADGFLKQMVRNLVGCLVEAGRGKLSPQNVRSVLYERDRKTAPATAPAQGLSLVRVLYPGFDSGEAAGVGNDHHMGPGEAHRSGPVRH